MAVWIQDDYWEAAQVMPEKQRAAFLYAIIEYGQTGKEPKGNPPWLPTFLVIRQRIELSREKSEKGRKMAEARWGKRDDPQASGDGDAQADPQHMQQHDPSICTSICTDDATASNRPHAESEIEILEGENPPNPPFAWQCLGAFNEAMGTAYTSMPPKCEQVLERFEGSYALEDVRRMVAYKRDEWRGTRFANCLTPNTLFSLDHFEQYVNQAREEAASHDRFSDYDD